MAPLLELGICLLEDGNRTNPNVRKLSSASWNLGVEKPSQYIQGISEWHHFWLRKVVSTKLMEDGNGTTTVVGKLSFGVARGWRWENRYFD